MVFSEFQFQSFHGFHNKKCTLKTLARGKNCIIFFMRTIFFKKELRAGTFRQREHLLYVLIIRPILNCDIVVMKRAEVMR